jgi:hypothetical protein
MINLIPNQEKKNMRKSFYMRLTALIFTSLGVAVFIGAVALIPAYLLSSVKKDLANVKVSQNTEDQNSEGAALTAVNDLKSRVSFIEKRKEQSQQDNFFTSYIAVEQILKSKTPDIKITSISYNKSGEKKTISLRGEAGSRERLLLFRKALEENKIFKKVDLPISNFVKESDIKFYVDLIVS